MTPIHCIKYYDECFPRERYIFNNLVSTNKDKLIEKPKEQWDEDAELEGSPYPDITIATDGCIIKNNQSTTFYLHTLNLI